MPAHTSLHAVTALVWLLLALFGCASIESRDQPGGDRTGVNRPAEVDELPVQFQQGLAIVEAEIEGLDRPARLVIDSGAVTIVKSALAPHLAYSGDESVVRPIAEDGMGRLVDFTPVLLRRLRVGRQTLHDVPAALVASDVFDRVCPPIDGLLGTGGASRVPGLLDRVAVEIDRDRQRVRISQDGALLGRGDIKLPLRRYLIDTHGEKVDHGGTWIPVVLEGQLLWAQLDTGGGGLSTMTSDVFAEMLGRSVDEEGVREYLGSYGVSVGGSSEGESWIAEISHVRLGRFDFGTLPFRIVPPRQDEIPMIVLSQGLLEQVNMVLDYRRDEVRLSGADSGPYTDTLPLQLSWDLSNGRIVIAGMLADGAAQKAGIQLGDEVVMANGVRVPPGDLTSMCYATRWQASQDDLSLKLRRGAREYEVTLPRTEP